MNIVIFDTETTGLLQPENSDLTMQPKIIEFYGVKINEEFEIQDELDILIDPEEPISKLITDITGITNSMVKGKKTFAFAEPYIRQFFENTDISVAHNHSFDSGMLDSECKRFHKERPRAKHEICTVEATMSLTGHRLSLKRLHWMLLQKEFKPHRAKEDVYALVRCFHNLTESKVINLEHYSN